MIRRVAVASRSFSRHSVLRAELCARHANVTFNEGDRSLAGRQLVEFLAGHDAAITALERLDDSIFAQLPELKIVAKYGVGLDMIDLPAMARRQLRLGWTAGVNRTAVAELVVAMMISLLRRVPEAAAATRAGQWAQIKGGQLSGRVIGIIGCGHVGKELAPLLTAFRCTVLVHDIRSFPDFYAKYGIQPVDLPTLLNRSDIVTLHVPLDETTRGILDAQRLLSMKPGAILINAARGGLVDESAAVEMLKQGRLSGAAFDVFAEEPPTNSELLHLPNVLALPHIGGSTEEAILAMGRAAIAGLEDARIPTADLWGAGTS